MLADANLAAGVPSHGGNTGSNPVGDANKINNVEGYRITAPKIFPKRRGWTAVDLAVLYPVAALSG
jgi:hypothetical protein